MRAEEVAAPCGHDDQAGDAQFRQFGIVAEKGSRPGAQYRERQCHRAHELGRLNLVNNVFRLQLATAKNSLRIPLDRGVPRTA